MNLACQTEGIFVPFYEVRVRESFRNWMSEHLSNSNSNEYLNQTLGFVHSAQHWYMYIVGRLSQNKSIRLLYLCRILKIYGTLGYSSTSKSILFSHFFFIFLAYNQWKKHWTYIRTTIYCAYAKKKFTFTNHVCRQYALRK